MSADEPMPLVAHLRELRDRFRNAIIAVALAFAGLFPFANHLYTYVSEPLRALLPGIFHDRNGGNIALPHTI